MECAGNHQDDISIQSPCVILSEVISLNNEIMMMNLDDEYRMMMNIEKNSISY